MAFYVFFFSRERDLCLGTGSEGCHEVLHLLQDLDQHGGAGGAGQERQDLPLGHLQPRGSVFDLFNMGDCFRLGPVI